MRLIKALLIAILAITVLGCATDNSNVDSKTGIKILQETPEQAYTTYYELFNSGNQLAAYQLISSQNKKNASKKDFAEFIKTLPYKNEKLVYVTAASEEQLAVVGSVKIIDVYETRAAVYSIFGMVREKDKWYMEMDVQGLDENSIKEINSLALEVHDRMKEAIEKDEFELSDEKYREQILGQIDAFKKQSNKSEK